MTILQTSVRVTVLFAAVLALGAVGAEVELRTADGQTLKGDILSVNAQEVELKSSLGTLRIPRASVVNPEVLEPFLIKPPAPQKLPLTGSGELDEKKILAIAAARSPTPQPSAKESVEIARLAGQFEDAVPVERALILEKLRVYGPKVTKYLSCTLQRREDLSIRVALLEVAVQRGQEALIPLLEETHATASRAYSDKLKDKPGKSTFFDSRAPVRVVTKAELKKQAEELKDGVLALERYASEVSGVGGALLLWKVYRERYSGEKTELNERERDAALLLAALMDQPKAAKGEDAGLRLNPLERALLIEKMIPYATGNAKDSARIAQAALAFLLPPGAPTWTSPQENWLGWWHLARQEMLKPPAEKQVDLKKEQNEEQRSEAPLQLAP